MQTFKISVSKGGKKYTIILTEENEIIARERVHKEGYSILSIHEIKKEEVTGHKYIFLGSKEGEIKKGKIVGDDIFKVYLKLRKDLGYEVAELYTENNNEISQEEKQKIIQELKEEYNIFIGGKKTQSEKMKEEIEKNRQQNKELKSFYLKKELEETYKLIDHVLEKIKKVINYEYIPNIKAEDIEDLKESYNTIIKLKKTTNIFKLREVGTEALLKIGQIELEDLEHNKNEKIRFLLKDTNKYLKKIGSKEQFIEKEKDIGHWIQLGVLGLKNILSSFVKEKTEQKKEEIDMSSYGYIKNQRLIRKYREKLGENTKEILKNIFSPEKRKKLFLKRGVIKQNIMILEAKNSGVSFSYTYIKHGYTKFFKKSIQALLQIKNFVFIIIVFFPIIFLLYFQYSYYFENIIIQYDGIFSFIFIVLLYFILYISRNIFFIFLNIAFLVFFFLFSFINF